MIEEYKDDFNAAELLDEKFLEKLEAFLNEDDEDDEELDEDVVEGIKILINNMGHLKNAKSLYKLLK